MEFAELISNLGFPMVCAIAMGVYVKGMTDKSNTQFLSMFCSISSSPKTIVSCSFTTSDI